MSIHMTDYAKTIADQPEPGLSGATGHMKACQKDTGITVRLSGTDFNGKKFSKQARSVSGAYFTMTAVMGLERAWHIKPNGQRKLLMRRTN